MSASLVGKASKAGPFADLRRRQAEAAGQLHGGAHPMTRAKVRGSFGKPLTLTSPVIRPSVCSQQGQPTVNVTCKPRRRRS